MQPHWIGFANLADQRHSAIALIRTQADGQSAQEFESRFTCGAYHMPTLEIEQGRFGSESHELHREQTVIGRYEFCDIVLETTSVSRQHARILRRTEGYFIEDLNSVNGTYVNRRKVIEPTPLHDGDEVHFYKVRSVFRTGDTALPLDSDTDVVLKYEMEEKRLPRTDVFAIPNDNNHAAKKLRALLGVMQSVGTSLNVDTVLVKILDGLFSVFTQSRRGHIWLVEEDGQPPILRAMKQLGSQTVLSDSFGPVSLNIMDEVMASTTGVLRVEEIDPSIQHTIFDIPVRSLICVPLIAPQKQCIGIIYIDTDESEQRFSQDDLEILLGVSAVAAQAISFAHEHEASLARAVELVTERERLRIVERQLKEAASIQKLLYPTRSPDFEGFEIAGRTIPTDRTCGDYFDFLPFTDGSLGLVVGDVSGHGLGPALHMVALRSCLHTLCRDNWSLDELLRRANDVLWDSTEDGRFVTMFVGRIEPHRRVFSYLGAGHDALVARVDGEVLKLEPVGVPLGLIEDFDWSPVGELPLSSGDVILIATDGFQERISPTQELFSQLRLGESLKRHRHLGAKELLDRLCDDVNEWAGGCPNSDDMTAIVIKVR